MSKESLLKSLKNKELTPLAAIQDNVEGMISLDDETVQAITNRVLQDSSIVKEYFDLIENPNYLNEPIPAKLENAISIIKDLRLVLTYYCQKPLKEKLNNTEWSNRISEYGRNFYKIEKLINQGVRYSENEEKHVFELYQLRTGLLNFEVPVYSLRQIFIRELLIPEVDPWFYVILGYNMTPDFMKTAETYYVYTKLNIVLDSEAYHSRGF